MLVFLYLLSFFFFSSRRRHTRWPRDWSSDVCSSDLDREEIFGPVLAIVPFDTEEEAVRLANGTEFGQVFYVYSKETSPNSVSLRSEEHTSELQSRGDHVCLLLLDIKNVTHLFF